MECDDGERLFDAGQLDYEDAGNIDFDPRLAVDDQDFGPSGFPVGPLIVLDGDEGGVEGEGTTGADGQRADARVCGGRSLGPDGNSPEANRLTLHRVVLAAFIIANHPQNIQPVPDRIQM